MKTMKSCDGRGLCVDSYGLTPNTVFIWNKLRVVWLWAVARYSDGTTSSGGVH